MRGIIALADYTRLVGDRKRLKPQSIGKQRLDKRLRIKWLQIVELLADADEFDWQAQLLLHCENRPALGRAIELGQDDARALDRFLELLGLGDGVLTRRRVQYQQHLVRRALDLLADDAANLF